MSLAFLHADWAQGGDCELAPGQWAPRYYRCTNAQCVKLVTYGQLRLGGCVCGNGRLVASGPLSLSEKLGLKVGKYPLTEREYAAVAPVRDCRVTAQERTVGID